jgi:hypothetical protein
MHSTAAVLHRPGFAKEAAGDPDAVLADLKQLLDSSVAATTARSSAPGTIPGRGLGRMAPQHGSKTVGGRGRRGSRGVAAERIVQCRLELLRRELGRGAVGLGLRHPRPSADGQTQPPGPAEALLARARSGGFRPAGPAAALSVSGVRNVRSIAVEVLRALAGAGGICMCGIIIPQ